MITSAQIREHKFELSSDGAYTAESVDKYMNELSAEFDSLYSENREIIKRLSVFAKKIEDYKRSEGVVADTLLTAQKSASQTIAGAADVVDKMLESAKGQGKKIIEAAHKEADSIKLDRDVIITEAQKTAQEITKNAAENAQNIISAADKKAREITDKAQSDADAAAQETKRNTDEYIKRANEENETEISRRLDEAQNKLDEAQTVLENAKTEADSIKEEAEGMHAEARKILDDAMARAEEIIFSAKEERAENVKNEIENKPEILSDERDNNAPGETESDSDKPAVEQTAEDEPVPEADTFEAAAEAEEEKIEAAGGESVIEEIKEDETVYPDEPDVVSDAASDGSDGEKDGDDSGAYEISDEADEFFSDEWDEVNIIENDVPPAVDSFTLDMNAFGIDDLSVTDSQPDSGNDGEGEPEEKSAEEDLWESVSDKTEEPVNNVKHDTVNPFDATGADNITAESDVLPDFEIDFSIFEDDRVRENNSSGRKDEKKESKKSKRSRRR